MDFMKIISDGYDSTIKVAIDSKDKINQKIKDKIRDIAYQNAIERCKQSNVEPNDLSSSEMGVIVNEEEKKLISSIKDMSFTAVLSFLGIDFLLG
jgi:aspartyl/asparaginyl-tRNA synthetase